ncbi:MAG: hypothetical protein KJ906_04420 [Nanoarchaeota archaeon]|nr:hypothetical protein [Nanoarchaeota archaeon]
MVRTNILGLRSSGRKPLSAKKKKAVKRKAGSKCQYRGCNQRVNLHNHHKDMNSSNDRASNIELLCPNHHAVRHTKKRRKYIGTNMMTGVRKTRLIKKPKKTVKKKTKRKVMKRDMFGNVIKKQPIKFKF